MDYTTFSKTPSASTQLKRAPWLFVTSIALLLIIFFAFKLPIAALAPLAIVAVLFGIAFKNYKLALRERFIRESAFPSHLKSKLRFAHPQLSAKDADLVEHGLRQFFIANLKSKGHFVAMPSQVVDAMWHDFILHTKAYEDWCKLAFGKVLHHTPAEAMGASIANMKRNDGLRRAWFWACKDESIDPRNPTRLPLLFALDKKLNIANGFYYVPDCSDIGKKSDNNSGCGGGDGSTVYCGTSFSDGSSAGSSDGGGADGFPGDGHGFGGADGGSSGSDGGGGGDGGGGCGGGD